MSKRRRTPIACFGICMIVPLFIGGIFLGREYADRQNCICSQLTDEIQQFEIDRKMLDVYDTTDTRTGTFVQVITQCKHGKRLQLMIFPDEGFYYGVEQAPPLTEQRKEKSKGEDRSL